MAVRRTGATLACVALRQAQTVIRGARPSRVKRGDVAWSATVEELFGGLHHSHLRGNAQKGRQALFSGARREAGGTGGRRAHMDSRLVGVCCARAETHRHSLFCDNGIGARTYMYLTCTSRWRNHPLDDRPTHTPLEKYVAEK